VRVTIDVDVLSALDVPVLDDVIDLLVDGEAVAERLGNILSVPDLLIIGV
jgi:hypothetical protein